MTNKEHQEWVIQKLNEDYAKRLEEYREVIEQQKTIIEQQKNLIDKLLTDQIVVRNDKVVIGKEIPNYPYPYYNVPITCSNATSSDNKYTCIAPKDATCNKECDDCCYRAQLC